MECTLQQSFVPSSSCIDFNRRSSELYRRLVYTVSAMLQDRAKHPERSRRTGAQHVTLPSHKCGRGAASRRVTTSRLAFTFDHDVDTRTGTPGTFRAGHPNMTLSGGSLNTSRRSMNLLTFGYQRKRSIHVNSESVDECERERACPYDEPPLPLLSSTQSVRVNV